MKKVQYPDGRKVSLSAFKASVRQDVYGGVIPPASVLSKHGVTLVDVVKPASFSDINTERERRLVQGAAFTVAGVNDPIPLQGRPFDQTVYLALLTRASGYKSAGVTDPVLRIRDATDAIHMLAPDQMISLISQAMTWFESVMATSWAMKDGTGDFTGGIPADYTADTHWP